MMIKSKLFKFYIIFCFLNFVHSISIGQITFEKIYDFPWRFISASSALPINSGYILVGSSIDTILRRSNNVIVRIDQYGDTLWSRGIKSYYYQMVISADSIINLVGNNNQGIISQYNLNGDSLRTVELYPYDTTVHSVFPISTHLFGIYNSWDGGLIVTGYRDSSICCNLLFFAMKLDRFFNTVWVWNRDNEFTQTRNADLIETSDHSILIKYEESDGGFSNPMCGIVKLDGDGNLIWTKSAYNIHSYYSHDEASNHDYIHCGIWNDNFSSTFLSYVERMDTAGNIIWRDTSSKYAFRSLCSTFENGIAMIGNNKDSLNNYHSFLRIYDNSGQLMTHRYFRDDITDKTFSIKETSDSGLIIAGSAKDTSTSSTNYNSYLIKTDKNGNLINSINNLGQNKISISPNPFSDRLFVSLDVNSKYDLKLYSTLGTLILKQNFQGNSIEFNLNNYSSGIYLMRIHDEKTKESFSTKLIKISEK